MRQRPVTVTISRVGGSRLFEVEVAWKSGNSDWYTALTLEEAGTLLENLFTLVSPTVVALQVEQLFPTD